MKIRETTERDCCMPKDLKAVEGAPTRGRDPILVFCVHCGHRHRIETFMDAAGSSDWRYSRIREDTA